MPTYEYICDACGDEFEREQRITEEPIKKCPSCGKEKARRMIGGGGFILKGGGWESDLYSGPSNKAKESASPKTENDTKTQSTKPTTPAKPAPKKNDSSE